MNFTQWQKLGLPVALGICAAFLNWTAVSRKLEPRAYVAVTGKVTAGTKLKLEDLKRAVISHDSTGSLDQTLIPWDKSHVLVGSYAQRDLAGGCLLTQFDLLEANVLPRASNEEVIHVKLEESERTELPVFVGDLVDLRLHGRKIVSGARVLSIVREDKRFACRVGVPLSQLANIRSDDRPNLKLIEHTTEIAKSN